MLDALEERCMSEQTWAAVRQALVDQFSDTRAAMTLAARLRFNLQAVTASGSCGPWAATVKVMNEDSPGIPKVEVALSAGTYKVEEKWFAATYKEQFLKSNLQDPRAAAALVRAVQALLREIEQLVDERLQALEQDPHCREARNLVDAIAVSRSLNPE